MNTIKMYQTEISQQRLHFSGRTFSAQEILDGQLAPYVQQGLSGQLDAFLKDWFSDRPTLKVQTSGSTGAPKMLEVSKKSMIGSALATCRFFHLETGMRALLCMDLKYIGAKMMVVRALVAQMELLLTETVSGHPFAEWEEPDSGPIDFAAVVPLQLYNSVLDNPRALEHVSILIVGGGAVEDRLMEMIQDLPTSIYSTYGMTETLSHIALRKLNGNDRAAGYTPLEGIRLKIREDGRLTIQAPYLSDCEIVTNDLVRLEADGSFLIEGRADNVIDSGGIKIQIEQIERELSPYLNRPLAITSLPDPKFGEKVILLLEDEQKDFQTPEEIENIRTAIQQLGRYERPKGILKVPQIPRTGNGKINRLACKQLVEQYKKRIFVY